MTIDNLNLEQQFQYIRRLLCNKRQSPMNSNPDGDVGIIYHMFHGIVPVVRGTNHHEKSSELHVHHGSSADASLDAVHFTVLKRIRR